ncbi:hypothetical protein BC351_00990 [Paenibacillus ferrarius]|uniref:Uncharacterized protein n=1 Tax=Paenibacillus ferrarius TaxID=1469647 RepID=A0A1V4HST2_9BACL|nr:hypothetical protein [Paenibacillus ferrarius]OPH61848.1 hypothetical protein BC351_00990 [Paenibacillus ferrarius]
MCYVCGGRNKKVKITMIIGDITYINFPATDCEECSDRGRTYGIGHLIYYPKYAKHLGVNEFDCDSIEWEALCKWIKENK